MCVWLSLYLEFRSFSTLKGSRVQRLRFSGWKQLGYHLSRNSRGAHLCLKFYRLVKYYKLPRCVYIYIYIYIYICVYIYVFNLCYICYIHLYTVHIVRILNQQVDDTFFCFWLAVTNQTTWSGFFCAGIQMLGSNFWGNRPSSDDTFIQFMDSLCKHRSNST